MHRPRLRLLLLAGLFAALLSCDSTVPETWRPVGDLRVDATGTPEGAVWSVSGPHDFVATGTGDRSWSDVGPGIYRLAWSDVDGWLAPPPVCNSLDTGSELVLTGRYAEAFPIPEDMVYVGPATFRMGSPLEELGHQHDEDLHHVTLTRGFLMGRYEVTSADWCRVYDCDPANPDHPVFGLLWDEAVAYCNARSEADGLTPAYVIHGPDGHVEWDRDADGWRLPTEAEWELACRAGTSTAFHGGEIEDEFCVDHTLEEIGWYCGNTWKALEHRPVGRLRPNALGLHDMHGNVEEFCWDGNVNYLSLPAIDPAGDVGPGARRAARGGSWHQFAGICRSAHRSFVSPDEWTTYRGFRVVRTVVRPE